MCSRCKWINKERKKNKEKPIPVCSSEYWAEKWKDNWPSAKDKSKPSSSGYADTY